MRTILYIFLFLTFVLRLGLASEVESIKESQIKEFSTQIASSVILFSLYSDSGECEDMNCHRAISHCSHHCNGSHITSIVYLELELSPLSLQNNKLRWYLRNHYQAPSLESSKKPPLFS